MNELQFLLTDNKSVSIIYYFLQNQLISNTESAKSSNLPEITTDII